MRYLICLEVNGIDMFSTVMKVVEANRDIKVTKSEMLFEEKRKVSASPRNRGESKFEELFHKHLVELGRQNGNGVVMVDPTMAQEWCVGNGYKASSASSLTSLMVKRGYLQKTDARGVFRLIYP